jgi:cytochrome P450
MYDMIGALADVLRAASARQDAPSSSPGTLGITLLLAVLAAWVVIRRFTMMDLFRIPTPWGSPFIGLGHLLQLALHVSNGHEQFIKWHEAYGPIVRLRLLHRDVVIVADPQVASELLSRGPNECPKRTPEYTLFNAVSSTGHADCLQLPAIKVLVVLSPAHHNMYCKYLQLLGCIFGLQAHGMPGYGAILTEQDEERWRAIRKAIAPAFTLSAVR